MHLDFLYPTLCLLTALQFAGPVQAAKPKNAILLSEVSLPLPGASLSLLRAFLLNLVV
jgi:hypothetical protein